MPCGWEDNRRSGVAELSYPPFHRRTKRAKKTVSIEPMYSFKGLCMTHCHLGSTTTQKSVGGTRICRSEWWEICQALAAGRRRRRRRRRAPAPVDAVTSRPEVLHIRECVRWARCRRRRRCDAVCRTSRSSIRPIRRTCARSATERCAIQWSSATADTAVAPAVSWNSSGQSQQFHVPGTNLLTFAYLLAGHVHSSPGCVALNYPKVIQSVWP